ncbi:MAG TPA: S8 family serine peptidase [Acidimicrobiales bacterium]|nr:S8 family serine peptidase [Acidimicrobiales bacterium]
MSSRFRLFFAAAAAVVLVVAPSPVGAVTDPRLAEQWGLAAIGAPAAWSVGTGNGTTIAVIDTGADFGHEDLRSKLLPGRNFVDPAQSAQDDQGHGSHVAGIAAAATGNGVGVAGTAPGARILPVKVLDADGSGSVADISEGIAWAAANGAHVINLSLGPNAVLATLLGSGLEEAVNDAWSKGSVVVIAAGNDFLFSSSYSTVNAVVVTATTREDRHAGYASGVGSAKWGISAPGGAGGSNKADDILSSHWKAGSPNDYEFFAGTSMATPYVAGAAAVLRGLGLSPQQTVDRLLSTAKDLGPAGPDTTYGAGRLDLAAAVGGLATPPLPPPTTPPARAASPAPPPAKASPAPVAPNATPAPAPAGQPAGTAPASGGGAAVAPGADPSSPAGSAPELAGPSPADQKRGSVGSGGGDDRPWIPIGGAALALAGSGLAVVWVQRNSRWD